MAWHNTYGKYGEEKVFHYLLDQGFLILDRNWRVGRLELDFVVLDGEELVVVEVKTRLRGEEYPEELLSYKKRKNLLLAGSAYLAYHKIQREIRFDLLLLTGAEMRVEHIRNAIDTF